MIVAKLTISYDRGISNNREKDLGLQKKPSKTEDGKVIRGLGTHFKSEEARDLVKERDRDAYRIRDAFRSRFLATPLEGVYMVPEKGTAEAFIKSMDIRADVSVRVTEFTLLRDDRLDRAEVIAWSEKIKRQLSEVSLGRKKEANEEGLLCIEHLAKCPLINMATGDRIRSLVSQVRNSQIDRIALKRSVEMMTIGIDEDALLSPQRVPVSA